jgi:hypothetical protein
MTGAGTDETAHTDIVNDPTNRKHNRIAIILFIVIPPYTFSITF